MKRILLLLLFAGGLHIPVWPQSDSHFLAADRNSIGVNLYPVIFPVTAHNYYYERPVNAVPFEIFYKRQVDNKSRAWRIGLLAYYAYWNENRFDGDAGDAPWLASWSKLIDSKTAITTYTVGGYIGHEWQRVMGKRWLLAWGSDLRYTYNHIGDPYDVERLSYVKGITPPYVSEYISSYYNSNFKSTTQTLSVHPFVEINFAITSRIAVNAGISLSIDYSFFNYFGKTKDTIVYENHTSYERNEYSRSSNEFRIGLLPFQRIGLIYSFY